ncbi:MAG: hypothetical protein QNJ09_02240 [Paracoccaceae bacterium]|nr:hypothetical protein [Paracoccaceae bacterium]
MAYFDPSFVSDRPTLRKRFARLFDTPFDRRSRRMAARIKTLRALSDAELAKLGIGRDDIVVHVFTGTIR